MATFLDIFNDLLVENNLNRKQFAEQSGIPYTTVIGWTNLNRLPDYSAIIKIADFFHCSVDYLVGRQDGYEVSSAAPDCTNGEKELLNDLRKLSENDRKLIVALVNSLLRKDETGNK